MKIEIIDVNGYNREQVFKKIKKAFELRLTKNADAGKWIEINCKSPVYYDGVYTFYFMDQAERLQCKLMFG